MIPWDPSTFQQRNRWRQQNPNMLLKMDSHRVILDDGNRVVPGHPTERPTSRVDFILSVR